jgi:type I restriction enzyme S subunit
VNAPIRVKRGPSSWSLARLGELAEHRLGKMLDKAKNTGVPRRYLRNPNVRWFNVDLSDLQEIRVEERDVHRYELRPGDVLICEGGEAGRAALWKGEEEGVLFQKACHRVRVGPRLDPRFLIHRLMYDYFSGGLDDYYTGTTIKHFTGQDLARYEFPLPPLDEQQRIVGILDRADCLRKKRSRAIDLLDTLARSIFVKMFENLESSEGSTRPSTVAEVSERIQIGPFGSILHKDDYAPDGVPLVNPMHIVNETISPSMKFAVGKEKYKQLALYHLREGDVVLGRRGEPLTPTLSRQGRGGAPCSLREFGVDEIHHSDIQNLT